MKKSILSLFFLITLYAPSHAQKNLSALMPMPNNITTSNGKDFKIKNAKRISTNLPSDAFCIKEFTRIIKERTGVEIVETTPEQGEKIEISIDTLIKQKERYTINITGKKISIRGGDTKSIFYALQTLDQILLGDKEKSEKALISPIAIDDRPRFGHRAVMLDPARHFIPLNDIKGFIDQMAKFKYNVLQLHLTDDQGWRIEIKSHPLLTEKGAFRDASTKQQTPDNGYYTQEELKELIQYAALRNIEIIPEIDIPGHSVAILTAYPELGCAFRQNETKTLGTTTNMMLCSACEKVYTIYNDIIKETAAIFPSEYIHLGGDEAAVNENWAKCENCLKLMHSRGCSTPSQLMNIFFEKILDTVRKNNKKAIMWCELNNIYPPADDYLFPYPQDVTLVTWRNALTPKCIELTHKYGHKLIMAPGEHAYLDYPQYKNDLPESGNWGMPVTTLEKCYELNPTYSLPEEKSNHIQGVMATMWAEAIKDIDRLYYMFFPRGLAIAECGWTDMNNRNRESFRQRLYPTLYELMITGIPFRVPFEIAK